MEYGPQLERIRSSIRGLAPRQHPDLKLEPPLTEQTVRVFEEEHCVALPVESHDKKEAIHTLQRMKVLSVSTLESLLVCSQSKDDDLRAAAYYALEAHRKSGTP